jgi:L-malate glycosyltransferase
MRILQIIQRRQLRGAEIFVCQLGLELIKNGVEVHYVYLFDEPAELEEKFPELQFTPLGASQSNRLWDLAAFSRLSKLIEKGRYDLVQANAGDTLKYAAFSRIMFRWKNAMVFRNANLMSGFIRSTPKRIFNRWLLHQCSWFISVSENCRNDLVNIYNSAADRSTTITIGTYEFNEVHAGIGQVSERPIFINIGSFVPEKNHEFLIDIFYEYYRRNMRGTLWLVGDGKLRERIVDRIKAKGIEDRVHLLGYRNDAISLLKGSDVMLMPSRVEGLPGVILEALSCEVPVIAACVGGVGEVITNGVTGFCLTEESIEKYVRYAEDIISDNELRSSIVRNGKALVREKFLMPQVASQFLNVYHHIIQRNKKYRP